MVERELQCVRVLGAIVGELNECGHDLGPATLKVIGAWCWLYSCRDSKHLHRSWLDKVRGASFEKTKASWHDVSDSNISDLV